MKYILAARNHRRLAELAGREALLAFDGTLAPIAADRDSAG